MRKLAVRIYRHINKKSRIESPIKYVRNGGTTKQYGCALCGAQGPTWCARYRVTKAVLEWCDDHSTACSVKYVAAHPEIAALYPNDANPLVQVAIDARLEGRIVEATAIEAQGLDTTTTKP